MATTHQHGDRLIRLPVEDTKANYLSGFWQWVERMANDDYQGAFEAVRWSKGSGWTAAALKERVTTFFGETPPWTVVVPNARLVGVINDATEFQPRNSEGWGWFLALIPVTTEPADPQDDKIPLMGLAASFFVRELNGKYVFDFEIFHA